MFSKSGLTSVDFPINSLRPRTTASRYIDLLKGIAVLLFMIYHIQTQLYPGGEEALKEWLGSGVLYGLANLGYPSIIALFVVSGYGITAKVLKSIQRGEYSWTAYLSELLSRLWGVLLPALCLTLFWAKVSSSRFGQETGWSASLDIKSFLGNLFFLHGIRIDAFGSNLPLSLLSLEFWFCLLFACLIHVFFAISKWKKAVYLAISLSIGWGMGISALAYFAIWLLGSIVAVAPLLPNRNRYWQALWLGGSFLFLWGALLGNGMMQSRLDLDRLELFPFQFIAGLAFACVIYIVVSFRNRYKRVTPFREDRGIPRWFARLSYPLLATHLPVILFISSWLGNPIGHDAVIRTACACAVGLGILVYAGFTALLMEASTRRILSFLLILKLPVLMDKPKNPKLAKNNHNKTP